MSETIFNFPAMIIGHRGSKGNIMENTLESIIYAIESGVDGVHFDIRQCLTGEIVLFHDETLDRLAFKDDFYFQYTQNKLINKLQWYHLYNTELIDSLGRKYKIPQLQDVLRCPKVYNSDVLINIQIHDSSYKGLTGLLSEVIQEGLYEPSRFLLSSTDDQTLIYLKEFQESENYEKLKIGKILLPDSLLSNNSSDSEKTLGKVTTFQDFQDFWIISSKLCNGHRCIVYTNERGKNIENSVDGIITDRPEIFKTN